MKSHSVFPIYDRFKSKTQDGREAILDLIERETGERPLPPAIRQWERRYKRLPAKFILIIVYECMKRRIKFVDSDFDARA